MKPYSKAGDTPPRAKVGPNGLLAVVAFNVIDGKSESYCTPATLDASLEAIRKVARDQMEWDVELVDGGGI